MPFMRVIILGIFMIGASAALAGPWPREKGETFLSYSIETDFERGLTDGSGLFGSLYAEHGLTDRLTLGIDVSGDDADFTKGIAFLRWPVGPTDRTTRIAAEFGIGLARDSFALRPGLSVGRGLRAGDMPGWLSIDSRTVFIDSFDGLLETDVTLGLTPTPKTKLILQLQTGLPWDSDPYAKLAPSYVHRIAPGRHVEVGVVAGVAEADDFKMKIGFWHQF